MSKYEYIPIGEEGVLLQIKGNCKIVFFTFFIGNFSKKSKKEKSAYGRAGTTRKDVLASLFTVNNIYI